MWFQVHHDRPECFPPPLELALLPMLQQLAVMLERWHAAAIGSDILATDVNVSVSGCVCLGVSPLIDCRPCLSPYVSSDVLQPIHLQ